MAKKNIPNNSFDVAYLMDDPNGQITLSVSFDNIQTAKSSVKIERTEKGEFNDSFSIVLGLAKDLNEKRLKLDMVSVGKTDNEDESTAEIKLSGGKKDKILPGEGLAKQVNSYFVRVDLILP